MESKTDNLAHECFLSTQIDVGGFLASYIDVNIEGNWHAAEILQASSAEVVVLCRDLPAEIAAERIKLPSPRVTFFRARTKPTAERCVGVEMSVESIDLIIKKLNEVVENYKNEDKKEGIAHTITQVIRGDAYFCIESIFMSPISKTSVQNVMSRLFTLFKLVSELILLWSKEFTREHYELSKEYPKLYLVSSKIALLECYPEFSAILNLIFSPNKKAEDTLKTIAGALKKPAKDMLSEIFNSIFKKEVIPALEQVLGKKANGVPAFPLKVALKLTGPFKDVKEARELAREKLEERLCNSCAKEDKLEILNEITVQNFADAIEPLFSDKVEFDRVKDQLLVQIFNAQTELGCTLSQLNSLIEFFKKDINLSSFSLEDQSKLDKAKLAAVLTRVNSIDFVTLLFQKNSRFQLIRDHQDIIKFLIQSQSLSNPSFTLIWNAFTTAEDSEFRSAVSKTIKLFACYASPATLEYILKLIKEYQLYEQSQLEFLFSYTLGVFSNIARDIEGSKKLLKSDGILYDSNTFWETMLIGKNTLSNLAMKYLIILCGKHEPLAGKYIDSALEIVKKEGRVVVLKFLKSLYLHLQGETKNHKELFKPLVDKIIFCKSCFRPVKYLSYVKGIVQSKGYNEEMMSSVFNGECSHDTAIVEYFAFIEFLCFISNGKLKLKLQFFEELWTTFVESPNSVDERNLFFLFVSKPWENSKESKPSYYFIDNSLCKEVLLRYFSDAKVFKLKYATVDGYKCFEAVFFRYNQHIGSIAVDGDKIILSDGAIEGISVVWRLIFFAIDEEVKNLASRLLVDLYIALRKKDVCGPYNADYDLTVKLIGNMEYMTVEKIGQARSILRQYIQK